MSTGIRRGNFLKKVPPDPFKDFSRMVIIQKKFLKPLDKSHRKVYNTNT